MASIICPRYSSQLTIDLGAIRSNYREMAEQVAPAECGAVVKADAYGLGVEKVAPALHDEGCRSFFVAQLGEAFSLSESIGFGSKIFVLNGVEPGCEALCAHWNFVPVLNSRSQVARWRALARVRGRALPAALQVDSGMSRLGLDKGDVAELAKDPAFGIEVSLSLIMTHLACADEPAHPANNSQIERFQEQRLLFPDVPASVANSAGALLPAARRFELARAGIALYGAPSGAPANRLCPVVGLAARILQIREVSGGDGVGYGLDYVAPGPRRLATVAIGYADGWPPGLGDVGAAWHNGERLPIVGRVSMDSLTVDISSLSRDALSEGDFVELLGPSQSLADVAGDAGTIAYEILTRLGVRHQRVYVDGDRTEIVPPPGARR